MHGEKKYTGTIIKKNENKEMEVLLSYFFLLSQKV